MHKDIKIMKIKNLLFLVPMLVMSLFLVSCGDDDDNDLNNGGSNGDNTEIKGDYIATTSVKTLTLVYSGPIGERGESEKTIYEDYNNLYSLALSQGNICFPHYVRSRGNWSTTASYGDNDKYHGIKDVGKVSSLSEVNSKEKANDYTKYWNPYAGPGPWYNLSIVQPNHGYTAYFTTENDEIKYMRIFVKDYKLDDEGSLASITIQYQLY